VQALRTAPYVTYREAVEAASAGFSSRYNQHPQVEGNIGRPVFGSEGEHEDPFIQITSGPVSTQKFRIAAGSLLGIQPGTFLAVYKPEARKLVGDRDKLANARVVNVSDRESEAELDTIPASPIPAEAKIAIVTPYFGALALSVNLDANPKETSLTDDDRAFINNVSEKLKPSALVAVLPMDSSKIDTIRPWDLGIQKGCLNPLGEPIPSSLMNDQGQSLCAMPLKTVFYLVTPDRNAPLFHYWITPNEFGAERLVEAIETRVKQENIRALSNARSPYAGRIAISIFKIPRIPDPTGKARAGEPEAVEGNGGAVMLRVGQSFQLQIGNDSDDDLNVALVDLGTGGSVRLITPRGTGQTVRGHSKYVVNGIYKIDPPLGSRQSRLSPILPPQRGASSPNFGLLEQFGVHPNDVKGVFASPIAWLVNQAGTGRSKDLTPSDLNLSSWTVRRLDISIEQ
jgi:hypothetical protein